jgi:ABC-2 type transport system permease protein
MFKFVIRTVSFLSKELNEIRRQPRLILSLIFGPLLVLLLFGTGYQSGRPVLSLALVMPEDIQDDVLLDDFKRAIEANFELVDIYNDREEAMQELRAGNVDVVQILPHDVRERMLQGNQSLIEFKYNDINPYNEQWIQYIGYAQVGEINRAILLQAARQTQQEAIVTQRLLEEARENLDDLEEGVSAAQRTDARGVLVQLSSTLDLLAGAPLLLVQADQSADDVVRARQQMRDLRDNLEQIEEAIDEGTLDEQQSRIALTRERIDDLEETVDMLAEIPPEVLVSPLHRDYENVRGKSLDFMAYYAPGVLMLVLQHIAITLGALSLVRERMLGAFELYHVAPVSTFQMLMGKYLGYMLCLGVLAAILSGFMVWGLEVPFLGNPTAFAVLLLLFTISALGVGFLISLMSGSESQAVQLSMLSLLMSIFFSGFFLPLEHFNTLVTAVGALIPLTHGIAGSQAIMLEGIEPTIETWISLIVMTVVTFMIVIFASRQQFHAQG